MSVQERHHNVQVAAESEHILEKIYAKTIKDYDDTEESAWKCKGKNIKIMVSLKNKITVTYVNVHYPYQKHQNMVGGWEPGHVDLS